MSDPEIPPEEESSPQPPPVDVGSAVLLELEDYKSRLKYALAEMENMRKRLVHDKQEMIQFAVENVILEFLEPIDNLEKALGFSDQMSEETRSWAVGFQMILGQFKSVLNRLGVTTIHAVGRSFDPHLHHAVEVEVTTEVAPNTIIAELMKGYSHKGRTLRHAKVKVAAASENNAQQNKETLS